MTYLNLLSCGKGLRSLLAAKHEAGGRARALVPGNEAQRALLSGTMALHALAAKWPWLTSFQRELALSWQHWGQPACAKQGQMAAVACQAWHHGGTLKATPNLLSWQNGPG